MYWKEESKGCKREDFCRYLHTEADKFKTMDSNKDTAEKIDLNAQSDSQEVLINKFDNNSASKLLELENVLNEKRTLLTI